MRHRFMLALTGALLAILAIGGIAIATPSVGVTSTTIATGRLDQVHLEVKTGRWKVELETKGQSDVTVVENRVAPGGTFGWHTHPGPQHHRRQVGDDHLLRRRRPDLRTGGRARRQGRDRHRQPRARRAQRGQRGGRRDRHQAAPRGRGPKDRPARAGQLRLLTTDHDLLASRRSQPRAARTTGRPAARRASRAGATIPGPTPPRWAGVAAASGRSGVRRLGRLVGPGVPRVEDPLDPRRQPEAVTGGGVGLRSREAMMAVPSDTAPRTRVPRSRPTSSGDGASPCAPRSGRPG